MDIYAFNTQNNSLTRDLIFDCVLRENLIREVTMVPEYHSLRIVHGNTILVSQIPRTVEERSKMRFFKLVGHQITSIHESDI